MGTLFYKLIHYAYSDRLLLSLCWLLLTARDARRPRASLARPAAPRPTAPLAARPPTLAAAPTTSTAVLRTRARRPSASALDRAPARRALALAAVCPADSAPTKHIPPPKKNTKSNFVV